MKSNQEITLALTGASGAPYALRLLEALLQQKQKVHLLASSAARVVLATEHGIKLSAAPEAQKEGIVEWLTSKGVEFSKENLHVYGKEEWFSPVASGSAAPKRMVICPCSTGTLSAVANGASDNLIERAADVVLKERGQLIIVPREMPFNAIHLEHMHKLALMGVTIMPASPGFYHNPESVQDLIDFVVARILDHLELPQTLAPKWGYGGND